jgi:hypothetical protein
MGCSSGLLSIARGVRARACASGRNRRLRPRLVAAPDCSKGNVGVPLGGRLWRETAWLPAQRLRDCGPDDSWTNSLVSRLQGVAVTSDVALLASKATPSHSECRAGQGSGRCDSQPGFGQTGGRLPPVRTNHSPTTLPKTRSRSAVPNPQAPFTRRPVAIAPGRPPPATGRPFSGATTNHATRLSARAPNSTAVIQ